jgi:hypothetical protein
LVAVAAVTTLAVVAMSGSQKVPDKKIKHILPDLHLKNEE